MTAPNQKATDEQIIAAWNDLTSNPDRASVAASLGIHLSTLKSRTTKIRKARPNALISRHNVIQAAQAAGRASSVSLSPQLATEIHVVTCAQNNTTTHPAFKSLLRYCKDRGAKLHVVPLSYKTSTPGSEKDDRSSDEITWPGSVVPYLMEPGGEIEIANGHGVIIANQIQATAVNPTQGYESIGGNKWVFLGHPQIQMRVTPTASHQQPKLVYTSGSMTVKNYREGTAGAKGEFHHSIGATVIEVCGNHMHVRQLNADDKHSIYDIHGKWSPTKSEPLDGIAGIVTGDEHEMFYSPLVKAATYGPNGMVDFLKPARIVRHDVLDFWSRNHHHDGDPIVNFVKHHSGTNSVERELDQAVQHLDETSPFSMPWFEENVIVASNHPEALLKWLKRAGKTIEHDPENALIYHKLWTELYSAARLTSSGAESLDPFEWYVKQASQHDHRFVGRDDSFLIAGIDVSQHGDFGASGARGSANSFAKAANKMIIAHSHTPAINKGVYQVGHSTDGMNYAKGHSGWMNTHCLIYPNGKRSLIHVLPIGYACENLVALD
jgi:hypothetical protein